MSLAAHPFKTLIIGAGPAGLMSAQTLAQAALPCEVYDAMPSVGRKFLLAGRGGLNLTHAESHDKFLTRFAYSDGDAVPSQLQVALDAFNGESVRAWAARLGIETFVGTSGRVFPTEMKAAPLLRSWLHKLRSAGVRFHMRHRLVDLQRRGGAWLACFEVKDESGQVTERESTASAVILALGGKSWARLGSDGAWEPLLTRLVGGVSPLVPANCGFETIWSDYFKDKFAGQPLKTVSIHTSFDTLRTNGQKKSKRGEFVITEHGVEGSLIYAFSRSIRDAIEANGACFIQLDLLPDRTPERVLADVQHPRGSRSLSGHLQSKVGLDALKTALLRECLSKDEMNDAAQLAAFIKCLPLKLLRPRPIDEAISTAGGVRFADLDTQLMSRASPGLFVAGEMLDWEAPTGGYLLTACLATGHAAGLGAIDYCQNRAL